MSRIRVVCRHCGHVVVAGDAIDLIIWVDEPEPQPSYYSFRCSACSLRTVTQLDEPQLQLLRSHGARPRRYGTVRAEPPPPPPRPRHPSFPPLTRDDLLDLHLLLQRADWWERFLAADGRPAHGAPGGQLG
ncbi:hypothetical protein [Egicoccus sp. AB-alg2]|uniref:hypothetical protein n=1 Tax=Egicoccus sp. AB-alg2 TaxID=3242693 RepID=UPI00359E2DBB